MNILFCTPFKPLDHPRTSGDVTIARDLVEYLAFRGHRIESVPFLNTEGIAFNPLKWIDLARKRHAARKLVRRFEPDLWLTYHTYYKAPDMLGPMMRRSGMDCPYCLFAAAYATSRKRSLKTRPGFLLNRQALQTADHVFANKREDMTNLTRLLARERLSFIRPGIRPDRFAFNASARRELRNRFAPGDGPVVVTAAMLRHGVKADGVEWVIRTCSEISSSGYNLHLLVLGDGPARERLEATARGVLPGRYTFAGKIPRERMAAYYSAGDLFVFPGINEGLGMVYLEAQACGLPVVAFDHDGAPEVVDHGRTGIITPSFDASSFTRAVRELLADEPRRKKMGRRAAKYVRDEHDLDRNYAAMEGRMLDMVASKKLPRNLHGR
jgi:glycosyltransferase involved in cell wall biosynthesis